MYVPQELIDEHNTIKKTNGTNIGSHIFKKIAKYSQVGREFEKIMDDPAKIIIEPIKNILRNPKNRWKYNKIGVNKK